MRVTAVYDYPLSRSAVKTRHRSFRFASFLSLTSFSTFCGSSCTSVQHYVPARTYFPVPSQFHLSRSCNNLPTPSPMHLFTPLRGLSIRVHVCIALSRPLHHRHLIVSLVFNLTFPFCIHASLIGPKFFPPSLPLIVHCVT